MLITNSPTSIMHFNLLTVFDSQFVCNILQITDIAVLDSQFLATSSEDGIVCVWSVEDREPTLQFQVMGQVKINTRLGVALCVMHYK